MTDNETYHGVPVEDLPWTIEQMDELRAGQYPMLEKVLRDKYPFVAATILDGEEYTR